MMPAKSRIYILNYILLAIFALLPVSGAQQGDYTVKRVDIIFDINQDNSVRQYTTFYFSGTLPDASLNYTVSERVGNIIVSGDGNNLGYNLLAEGDQYNIQILIPRPISALEIDYTADNMVFLSDAIKNFFTEFSFPEPVAGLNVQVKLPEGYGVYQNSYIPSAFQTISDGSRIILSWNGTSSSPVLFSVKYTSLNPGSNIWLIAAIIAAGLMVGMYLYFKNERRGAFLSGFSDDEKKTILYLEGKKTALQSDLEKEFKFSRAKTTRIVSKLAEKSLVKKQKYGRTNKLSWMKQR